MRYLIWALSASLNFAQSHFFSVTPESSLHDIVSKAFSLREQSRMPAVINLSPGRYTLSAPIVLPTSTSDLPSLTFRGPADNSAILDGGIELKGWVPCMSQTWLFCSTPSVALQSVDQLWANGARRFVARTPIMTYNSTVREPNSTISYVIVANQGQLRAFAHLDTLRVGTYHSWTASYHTVRSVILSNNTIIAKNPIQTMFDESASGKRYWLENAPELLTQNSGTFYFDKTSNQVIYAPFAHEYVGKSMNVTIFAATVVELVRGTQVSNVHFESVVFEHAAVDWSNCLNSFCDSQSASFLNSAALHWDFSSSISLTNVTVRHVGGYALWMGPGVVQASISRCHFHDLGAGAVRIGDAASGVDPRVAKQVTLEDSVLEDGGHVYHEGCGVLMQAASQCVVTHNDINTFRYTGISVGWTWSYEPTSEANHEISFNRITTIGMRDLSDMGCIYHLGQDNGTKIVSNVCSNVTSFDYGGWGYYTDQASRNVLLQNNIAYDIKCGGFHQHYGMSNTLNNNIFAFVNTENCDGAVRSSAHNSPGDEGDVSNFAFDTNIVYWGVEPAFFATTKNSFMNTTFSNNVYYNFNGSSVTFPCPLSGRDFLGTGESLYVGEYITSQNQQAFALMGADGRFCVFKGAKPPGSNPVWCTPNQPAPGNPFFIAMQGDGNLCIYKEPTQGVWCNMVHPGTGEYFLQILDDLSLCVHQGEYPSGRVIWCANNTAAYERIVPVSSPYPTTCSFVQWQKEGRDINGVVADPLFVNAAQRDFTLQPSSPALKLGFKQIDTSTVGPRS